jgi:predicted nuclease of restriction endonuclease-like RecB superfamily
MLTSDLAMSWQRGDQIRPRYIKTTDAGYVREAGDLIALFEQHEGGSRAALEQSLQEYVGTGTDYKILRGLIKLLTDRCEFETATEVEPAEIRRALFTKACGAHPVVDEAVRARVVEEAARELGCTTDAVLRGLYADLPENQKLVSFERLTARELLDLYNVAQAQALLYRCVEMRLWVAPQAAEGYRALFGAIKTYRLIHTVRGDAARGYEIRLDGPVSLFQRSQKYGIQMAVFLPALLLCTGWRMRAEISTGPGQVVFFELTSEQTQLRSHYLNLTPYENPVVEKLAENWERSGSLLELEPSSAVIDLGDSAFIPDYVIRHPSGREVYLEVLGFWTPQHLLERLKDFEHAGRRDFILAAWEELRGSRDALANVPAHTIVFKRNLDPGLVALMVEKIIAEEY